MGSIFPEAAAQIKSPTIRAVMDVLAGIEQPPHEMSPATVSAMRGFAENQHHHIQRSLLEEEPVEQPKFEEEEWSAEPEQLWQEGEESQDFFNILA
jgi:hypothetical protein